MKNKIIKHYEKRIKVNEEKKKGYVEKLKIVIENEMSEELVIELKDKINKCENNIELLTEQLEFIKVNLK